MHYYKRNLGDYAKKAGKLSMLQHGAYTVLIDACYDREQFPTMEEAIDWSWASSAQEIEAVEFVLRKFFKLVDGRYMQDRIQEEIETYQRNCEINARIATEREEKRKASSPMRARTVNESPPNHKPLTINQEPETKEISPLPPEGGDNPKSRKSAIALNTYLAECKASGDLAIPPKHSVFDYAAEAKIPEDFLRLQWLEFRDRYSEEGAKRYKAWPTVFGKSVRGNWFKLWYFDNSGACTLTTTGIQARNTHEARK